MMDREKAIQQIKQLMHDYAIEPQEIFEIDPLRNKTADSIKKSFAYLGGVFIFCGFGFFLQENWSSLNSISRVLLTLGLGLIFFTFAAYASQIPRFRKTFAPPFFLIAAIFETGGAFVLFNEYFNITVDDKFVSLVIFFGLLLQNILMFRATRITLLLFLSIFFGLLFLITAYDLANINANYAAIVFGMTLLCISYGVNDTEHRIITPFWYAIGAIFILSATFNLVHDTTLEYFYLILPTIIIYLSTLVRSRMLLFCGTIAMIGYIAYISERYFVDSLGWPLALILFGILFILLSAFAWNIGRWIKPKE